jgi:hypothetical protein
MVSGLQEINSLPTYFVNQPMLLRDSSGPRAGQLVLQSLRLSDSVKWIHENSLNQKQDAQRRISICFYPPAKIFTKFRLENCFSLISLTQGPSPAAIRLRWRLCLAAAHFDVTP